MSKGIIYYTDNKIGEPIIPLCQKYIKASGLPIVSCSLNKPIDFGENYVHIGMRSYPTMLEQIVVALEHLKTDNVFFCEHDVLYHLSHFEFTPPTDDIYYYNANNWRWRVRENYAITYEWVVSLSQLCCNRKLALNHFYRRVRRAKEENADWDSSREPRWARKWGYEPGTKPTKRGGFSDEHHEIWFSKFPNVDLRHKWTLSCPKTTLEEFRHPPKKLEEIKVEKIPGWNWEEIMPILKP